MSVTTTPDVLVPAGRWAIDGAHSAVEFAVGYLGIVDVKGRATDVAGTIVGGETPSVEGVVQAASLTTHDETRDLHLRSPEFFDVERHPELRFASTAIAGSPDALVVSGALTIKGVTRPVELRGRIAGPAVDLTGARRIGLDLEGSIDRTAFGLRWNAPLPGGGLGLGDTVRLVASFSAVEEL